MNTNLGNMKNTEPSSNLIDEISLKEWLCFQHQIELMLWGIHDMYHCVYHCKLCYSHWPNWWKLGCSSSNMRNWNSSRISKKLASGTELVLISGLQNEICVLATWIEETLRYIVVFSALIPEEKWNRNHI